MLKSALYVFLISCLLGHLNCTVQKELIVKEGEDATLQCYSPTNATTVLLRWEKPDLQSDLYVFYVRDGRPNENYELPRFKDRVKLKAPEWMKNGEFSVILKNVSMNDAGKYDCHAGYNKQKPQLLSSINLKVEESGQTEEQKKDGGNEGEEKEEEGKEHGSARLIGGPVVVAVLLFAAAAVFVYFYKCRNTRTQYHGPQRQEEADTSV